MPVDHYETEVYHVLLRTLRSTRISRGYMCIRLRGNSSR